MNQIIKLITEIVNNMHDLIMKVSAISGLNFTDKQLHFIIIAVIGMIVYLVTNSVFKYLAKYSVQAISFIYTFTVLVVLVFAIEIEQKITKRGNMEFNDIAAGLWGFIIIFGYYLGIIGIFKLAKYLFSRVRERQQNMD